MIVRLVKLTFQTHHVDEFLDLFGQKKDLIRQFPGCRYLQLLQADAQTFFTISHWDDENALDNYRHSELFRATWAKTRILFAAPPRAWSMNPVATLPG